jgi:hypothetical protein
MMCWTIRPSVRCGRMGAATSPRWCGCWPATPTGKDRTTRPTWARIGDQAGVSRSVVARTIRWLREHGYLGTVVTGRAALGGLPPISRTAIASCCEYPMPHGVTISPPGRVCAIHAAGMWRAVAVERIRSYGARGFQPSVPSPVMTAGIHPAAFNVVRAASASVPSTSIEVTCCSPSRADSKAAHHPVPVPGQ